jgi:hypothetical protein
MRNIWSVTMMGHKLNIWSVKIWIDSLSTSKEKHYMALIQPIQALHFNYVTLIVNKNDIL